MLKTRAYSTLTIKSIDDEQRVITGIASSPATDRNSDIVEPKGAKFTLPLPLLFQHRSGQPIGHVLAATVTDAGIEIRAQIAKLDIPWIDEAWALIKAGLVRGLSIGMKPLETARIEGTYGYRYLSWEWLELSAVTIPANQDANILTIKSLDVGLPAPGPQGRVSLSAGVSAPSRVVTMRTERPMKKSYADQIAAWEATRAAKTARMDELLSKSGDAGVTLDEAEQEEHDTLGDEVDGIDKQLVRLRAAEAREKAAATPAAGRTPAEGLQARAGARITVERKLPQGIGFARYAMCMGLARGNPFEAKQLALTHYPDDPGVLALIEKTAVGAANAQTAGSGCELVPYNVMDDFIEYLRPRTILGKFGANGIPALTRVPFNVRTSGFSAGLTANWVGEGLPALVSKATSFTLALTWAKIAALTVLTKEEMRFSNPSAEAKVRDDITKAVVYRQDIDFIDPGKAAVANVSPQSITFNTTPLAPSAATAAAFRTDFATLLGTFATLMLDPSDIVIVMSTIEALNLSLMITSLGNPVFPGLTMQGGMLLGFPVITSEALVALGSPDEDIIVAVKAGDIYLADDGVVTVDASDQASVEMVDTSSQSGLTGTGASLVSFWQSGLVGLKAEREITWKLRRTGAARYLGPCLYRA